MANETKTNDPNLDPAKIASAVKAHEAQVDPSKHPSSPTVDTSQDDEKTAKARARVLDLDDDDDDDLSLSGVSNIGAPVGKPIQCIVKKTFFSDEQQVVDVGRTYYFQLREGQTFPSDVLEPVDQTLARQYAKAFRLKARERHERHVAAAAARDNFNRAMGGAI